MAIAISASNSWRAAALQVCREAEPAKGFLCNSAKIRLKAESFTPPIHTSRDNRRRLLSMILAVTPKAEWGEGARAVIAHDSMYVIGSCNGASDLIAFVMALAI